MIPQQPMTPQERPKESCTVRCRGLIVTVIVINNYALLTDQISEIRDQI